MANTKIPASAIKTTAMGTLTVTTKAMAISVAMQGGITFHTDMFCKVKTALEVARSMDDYSMERTMPE